MQLTKINLFLIPSLLLSLVSFQATAQVQQDPILIQESAYNLLPTQLLVGRASVRLKAKKLGEKTPEARMEYLRTHPVPVVVGPGGRYYLIDHHHMSLALIESGHKKLFIQIVADWSDLKSSEFWSRMESSGYTYLYDAAGKKVRPQDLPKSVLGLKDDPYRSLAYFAREAGAFDKTPTPFAEFFWAAFYRKNIGLKELKNWKAATAKAVQISQMEEASHMPGFRGALICQRLF